MAKQKHVSALSLLVEALNGIIASAGAGLFEAHVFTPEDDCANAARLQVAFVRVCQIVTDIGIVGAATRKKSHAKAALRDIAVRTDYVRLRDVWTQMRLAPPTELAPQ